MSFMDKQQDKPWKRKVGTKSKLVKKEGIDEEDIKRENEEEEVAEGDLETKLGKEGEMVPTFGSFDVPRSFYIAHPTNVKRSATFKDVHSRKMSELLEAFHMFDFDRDGVLDANDLKKTFASLCIPVEQHQIQAMLLEGLSPLNFDAFVILLGYRTLEFDPEEVLLDALSHWDDHDTGLIPYDSLKHHIMAWGDKFTEEEAAAALADAPIILNKAKEKMIDYIQFSEDLCGLRKMMQKRGQN